MDDLCWIHVGHGKEYSRECNHQPAALRLPLQQFVQHGSTEDEFLANRCQQTDHGITAWGVHDAHHLLGALLYHMLDGVGPFGHQLLHIG